MARADSNSPDIRVSDAERDTVATELGQHFQDGRLDQAEFDKRVTAALAARTWSDLDGLLKDLPAAARRSDIMAAGQGARTSPGSAWQRPRFLAILPLILAAAVVGGMLTGGWHHGWPFAPLGFLWLLIPVLVIRARVRSGGRRQWR